jgi:endonuclease G
MRNRVVFSSLSLAVALLVGGMAEPRAAIATDCTTAQKEAADEELRLSTRDKTASTAQQLPWGALAEPAGADNEGLLVQRDYVIDYDADLRVPVWVAYRLDSQRLRHSPRIDCFRKDPRLSAAAASTTKDYSEPIFDQGHLANNADMTSSANSVINSFILSNMTPQYCQFNEGVWQMLENIVRLWAKVDHTVYVTTGSIFDRDDDGKRDADSAAKRMKSDNGDQRVAIPTAFFALLTTEGGIGQDHVEGLGCTVEQAAVNLLPRQRVAVPEIWLVDTVQHKVGEGDGIH